MTESKDIKKETACLFTGHRTLPQDLSTLSELERSITAELEKAYDEGYRIFYSGGATGFDLLCALTVLNLRHTRIPGVRLIFALPCYNHYKNWEKQDQRLLANLLEKADEVVYVSEKYRPGCMHKRNRYMVDRCALCIAYCTKKTGGTAYTVSYAQKKNVPVRSVFADNQQKK